MHGLFSTGWMELFLHVKIHANLLKKKTHKILNVFHFKPTYPYNPIRSEFWYLFLIALNILKVMQSTYQLQRRDLSVQNE